MLGFKVDGLEYLRIGAGELKIDNMSEKRIVNVILVDKNSLSFTFILIQTSINDKYGSNNYRNNYQHGENATDIACLLFYFPRQ